MSSISYIKKSGMNANFILNSLAYFNSTKLIRSIIKLLYKTCKSRCFKQSGINYLQRMLYTKQCFFQVVLQIMVKNSASQQLPDS